MDTERALARALCDSSSHANLIHHDEDNPCDYHRKRAKETLALLQRRGYGLGMRMEVVTEVAPERSRLNAENLRRRAPPIDGEAR